PGGGGPTRGAAAAAVELSVAWIRTSGSGGPWHAVSRASCATRSGRPAAGRRVRRRAPACRVRDGAGAAGGIPHQLSSSRRQSLVADLQTSFDLLLKTQTPRANQAQG